MPLEPWHQLIATPTGGGDPGRFARQWETTRDPDDLFAHTYLTTGLRTLVASVLRRLASLDRSAPAVYCLSAGFGSGKTHAEIVLSHLVRSGPASLHWAGVPELLAEVGLAEVPKTSVAVFSGHAFDVLHGFSGQPKRRTPWGALAFDLSGAEGLRRLEEHDRLGVAPSSELLTTLLPPGPVLILFDEMLNYVGRARVLSAGGSSLAAQFLVFLQNLTEAVQCREDVALVVTLPAATSEVPAEDVSDWERLRQLVLRSAWSIAPPAEAEFPEIVRRALFGHGAPDANAVGTAKAYANWARQVLPQWSDELQENAFLASFPFHPRVLSVWQRWRGMATFQSTRGVLRLLSLWVAHADRGRLPLLTLGTAPFESGPFRAAVLEQLGDRRWEGLIDHDVLGVGKGTGREVATALLLESAGGATVRLGDLYRDQCGPNCEPLVVEDAMAKLSASCYFLHSVRDDHAFRPVPNLHCRAEGQRASLEASEVRERIWDALCDAWTGRRPGLRIVLGPQGRGSLPDAPRLTLVVLRPEDGACARQIATAWSAGRTFSSALVFCLPSSVNALEEEVRSLLAWERLVAQEDSGEGDAVRAGVARMRARVAEAVRHTYGRVLLMAQDGQWTDLAVNTNAASPPDAVLSTLGTVGFLVGEVSPGFILRHWPPAVDVWNTSAIRDAFFSAPRLPRLMRPEQAVCAAVARGVSEGLLTYRSPSGRTVAGETMCAEDVVIARDALVRRAGTDAFQRQALTGLSQAFHWEGELPARNWAPFRRRVLGPLLREGEVSLQVGLTVRKGSDLSPDTLREVDVALADLLQHHEGGVAARRDSEE